MGRYWELASRRLDQRGVGARVALAEVARLALGALLGVEAPREDDPEAGAEVEVVGAQHAGLEPGPGGLHRDAPGSGPVARAHDHDGVGGEVLRPLHQQALAGLLGLAGVGFGLGRPGVGRWLRLGRAIGRRGVAAGVVGQLAQGEAEGRRPDHDHAEQQRDGGQAIQRAALAALLLEGDPGAAFEADELTGLGGLAAARARGHARGSSCSARVGCSSSSGAISSASPVSPSARGSARGSSCSGAARAPRAARLRRGSARLVVLQRLGVERVVFVGLGVERVVAARTLVERAVLVGVVFERALIPRLVVERALFPGLDGLDLGRLSRRLLAPVQRRLQLAHLFVHDGQLRRLLLQQLRRAPALSVQLVDERAQVEQERLAQAELLAQPPPHLPALTHSRPAPRPPLARSRPSDSPSGRP